MPSKTGKHRLRPDGDRVVLQVEETGIFGHRQQWPSSRWRDATPQDLADLVAVEITGTSIRAAA